MLLVDRYPLPDDYLLTPKQIAQISDKPIQTIYRWLKETPLQGRMPYNRSHFRKAYQWGEVKVWLQEKQDPTKRKRKGRDSHAYYLGKRISELRQTDFTKYLQVLSLLADKTDEEPGS
jgi:hypothetical protein